MTPSPSDLPSFDPLGPGTFGGAEPLPAKSVQRKAGPRSLTAAATRLTSREVDRNGAPKKPGSSSWQADAWAMFDLVGELRFLATTLANQGAQARFYVGLADPADPLSQPEPVVDEVLNQALDYLGASSTGRSQIVQRLLVNLFVAGDGYLVGIPKSLLPRDDDESDATLTEGAVEVDRDGDIFMPSEATLADLRWFSLSGTEVQVNDGAAKVKLPHLHGKEVEYRLDDIWLVYNWRQHPERGWEADSPTRSNLPVLRELVGLTMAISGQIDSRLAGAGILAIAQAVSDAAKRAVAETEDGPVELDGDADPLMDDLIEAMSTAIENRSSAASFTPIGVIVPDGTMPSEAFHHYTFDNPLDKEYVKLREEAIRRFALGSDAPPELLLGVGGMNHWGAWLVREDVINAHIAPPLAIVANALTEQYLWPIMKALGYPTEIIENTVIWYSVDNLIARPNASADAVKLYDRGELSGKALRNTLGFDEGDAPEAIGAESDPAVDLALQLVAQAPSLMQAPGLPAIVEQIRAVQEGREATAQAAEEAGEPAGEEETPAEEEAPAAPDRTDGGEEAPADGPPSMEAAAALRVSEVSR